MTQRPGDWKSLGEYVKVTTFKIKFQEPRAKLTY